MCSGEHLGSRATRPPPAVLGYRELRGGVMGSFPFAGRPRGLSFENTEKKDQMGMIKILFVCSGNTCRSPMALGIFRQMVARAGLEGQVLCQSAGLSAVEGEPASENAILACQELGVDLTAHRARRVSGEEIPVWDVFFTMSQTHGYILGQAGAPPEKVYIPGTIADPYGQDLAAYRACRDRLREELEVFWDKLVAYMGRQPFLP